MFPAGLQGQGSVPPAAWRPEEPPPAVPTQQHPCAIGSEGRVPADTPPWGTSAIAGGRRTRSPFPTRAQSS